jgi:CHAT domain-containing protein
MTVRAGQAQRARGAWRALWLALTALGLAASPLRAEDAQPGPPYRDIYNDPAPRLAAARAALSALGPDATPAERGARVSDLIMASIGAVDFKGAYELYLAHQDLPLHPDARAGAIGEGLVAFVREPAVRADYIARLETIAAGPTCRPCYARTFAAHHLARYYFTGEDDLPKSIAAHRRTLDLAREDLAPDDPVLVLFHYQLAQYTRMLDLEAARVLARETEETAIRLLPDERHIGWLYVLILNANIAQDRGRTAEAAELWGKVAVMGVRVWGEDDPNLLPIFQNHAILLSQLGRTAEAVATAERARANEGYSDAKERAYHQALVARLLLGDGRAAEAEAAYRRAMALLADVPADDLIQGAVRLGLADTLSLAGAHAEAVAVMREGLPLFQEKLPATNPARRSRETQGAVILARAGESAAAQALMQPVLAANEAGLLDLYARDSDRALLAGEAQGMLRDSVLVALLAGDAERAWRSAQLATISDLAQSAASLAYPGDAAGLTRALEAVRDARRAEEEARAALAGDAADPQGQPAEGAADAFAAAGTARVAAEQALARDFPDYAQTLRPRPLTIPAAQGLLGKGDAYILPLVYPDRVVTLALTADGFAAGTAATPLHAGRNLIARVRASLEAGLESDAPFDAASAHALHRLIFTPEVARLTRGKARLIFPASGALAQIPPAVLVTAPPRAGAAPRWLIRDHAIVLSPGLGVRPRQGSVPARFFAGIGAPALAPPPATRAALRGMTVDIESIRALPSLPGAREELEALSAAFAGEGTLLLTGAAATEAAVRSAPLADYRILAFATHGLVGGQIPGLDQPALVMTPGGEDDAVGDDGLMTASEIARLRLAADWIILSACNSAAGEGPGHATYSGLARAFQLAGARSLLLSHWPVRDDAAARLSVATVKAAAAGIERGEALRRAQLALIAARDLPGAASPSIWAPFVLIE